MKRTDLRDQPDWVVVHGDQVDQFKTFREAFDWQLDHQGHLMTLEYYTYHWLPEKLERLKKWNETNF